jgi:hypothetical protein
VAVFDEFRLRNGAEWSGLMAAARSFLTAQWSEEELAGNHRSQPNSGAKVFWCDGVKVFAPASSSIEVAQEYLIYQTHRTFWLCYFLCYFWGRNLGVNDDAAKLLEM